MSDILSPGEIIKPTVNQVDILDGHISQQSTYFRQDQAGQLLQSLYSLTPNSVKEFNSYDDRNFYFTVKESGDDIWPHGYILKVGILSDIHC